jgi:hypothetical protein
MIDNYVYILPEEGGMSESHAASAYARSVWLALLEK